MTFSPATDRLVGGRFRLEEQVDSGGLATVWRATDTKFDRPVAVKCGSDASHDRDEVRDAFRRELTAFDRLSAAVAPGSVVQFVDGTVDGDDAFVATELVDGEAVGDAVDAGSLATGLDAIRTVGAPLCAAADFLHQQGVVHCDLKPNNVLLRAEGPPALVDFNAAVLASEGEEVLFHRDGFKPPELTPTGGADWRVGPWSDAYSLGKLLAYLLTGEIVDYGDDVEEWAPVDPRDRGIDCPPWLADVVRRATRPEPDRRFQTAGDLLAALAPHLGAAGKLAHLVDRESLCRVRVPPGATIGRWAPEEPAPAVVLADEGRFVSFRHAVLEEEGGSWRLRDTSLNGTWVLDDEGSRFVISLAGLQKQRAAGRPLPQPDPGESTPLADGDRIHPVDPQYGPGIVFREG